MCMKEKGGVCMTDILTIDNMEMLIPDEQKAKNRRDKFTAIRYLLYVKFSTNKKLLEKIIVKDNKIRNGKPLIKGTRITIDDINDIAINAPKNVSLCEYILEQYPSIENEIQVRAALQYIIKYRVNTLKFIILTLL